MSLINVSIDLMKLPTAKVVEKNGKSYLLVEVSAEQNAKNKLYKREGGEDSVYSNFTVAKKREVDEWGKTHYVQLSQTKEERESGADRVYCGQGKEFIFNNDGGGNFNNNATPQNNNSVASNTTANDDLPF